MEDEEAYETVSSQLDIENFIIYNISQIYFGNTDWPGNNRRYWQAEGRKWEHLLYDTDFGFGRQSDYHHNTLRLAIEENSPTWPNPPFSTLFLRKLLNNKDFRNQFVNRYADELNSRFLPATVDQHLDTLTALVEDEMQRHFERWGGDIEDWYGEISRMKDFSSLRPQKVKHHILEELNLPAYHQLNLNIDAPSQGKVIINNRLHISESVWKGDYFESVPFLLKAEAQENYEFTHWSGDVNSESDQIFVDMNKEMTIQANFIPKNTSTDETVIKDFSVYPNPFTESFSLELNQPSESIYSINLLDNNGKLILKLAKNLILSHLPFHFNEGLAALNNGLYLLEIHAENQPPIIIKLQKY